MVIPSCFRFCENVFAPGKSPVKVQPVVLHISSLGEMHISLRVMNLTWTDLHSLAFILDLLPVFDCG
jgi:hypothetical protein